MVTLLAACLFCRQREITGALADLLIATVHRINARADTKVTSDFVAELQRVSGKENILFTMTEAAPGPPGDRVEDVIYRTGLIQIIEVLEFGPANTVHAPMAEALALIKRYKADVPGRVKCYAPGEHVLVDGIIPAELAELMYQGDGKRRRILRTVYECGVFQALREKLRCKEIWVAGAEKWRNPDLDLPVGFEDRRAGNCAQLRKPLDPRWFTGEMRKELEPAPAEGEGPACGVLRLCTCGDLGLYRSPERPACAGVVPRGWWGRCRWCAHPSGRSRLCRGRRVSPTRTRSRCCWLPA